MTTVHFHASLGAILEKGVSGGESWASIHDAAAADGINGTRSDARLLWQTAPTSAWRDLIRTIRVWDTSSLPVGCNITEAHITISCQLLNNQFTTTPYLAVVSANPADPTSIVVGDYDTLGTAELSNQFLISDAPTGSFADRTLTLTADGRNAINTTGSGYTKFGFRLSWDILDTAPTPGAGDSDAWLWWVISEELWVTYSETYENTVTESLRLNDFSESLQSTFGPEQLALSDSASVDVEGANPTSLFAVRIAFASNPFDNSPVWVDVTENLMSFHIRRGRQWELNRLEAGTAVVRLKNISGDYWPNNSSSALYPYVLPWKRINIRALYNGLTYDLYTGYIEAWEPSFLLRPIKAPVMDLTCSDGIKSLSQYLLNNTTGYSQEISGTRIDNVLTSLGWPSTARDIDAGQSLIQATGALEDVNAMTHIFTVEDTELGIFYESPSGAMVFQDRHKRLKAPYTTAQAGFGDTATTFGYTGIDLSFEDLRIFNDIRVTPLGGTTEQVATSTTSQDLYGPRSLQRPSLLMVSDAEALAQAQYLLSRYATPVMRCRKIEIRPNADADNLYPCVLGYDLSTRVTIKLTQATIDKDYHIEGIYHDWDVLDAAGLKTTWMLSDAETEQFWILEDPVFGVLDSTTIPAW